MEKTEKIIEMYTITCPLCKIKLKECRSAIQADKALEHHYYFKHRKENKE